MRNRSPQLDSRLWLDGIIAALTAGAISAAVVFGAVQASTGGDTAAVATNLAYPLGDMILIGTVLGAVTAARGRLDRTWLFFAARHRGVRRRGLDLPVPGGRRQLRRRRAPRPRMARRRAARRARRVAARRCARSARPSTSCPAWPSRSLLALVSLGILVYDHFNRAHLLAARARDRVDRGGGHPPVRDASREPRQPRRQPAPGAHRPADRARQPLRRHGRHRARVRGRRAARPAAVRPRRLQELQRLLRSSGRRRAARPARLAAGGRDGRTTAAPSASAATSSACSPTGRPASRSTR